MTISIYNASVPVFTAMLGNMKNWLDKAGGEREADLLAARLAPDMKPLTAQYQMASDTAKNALGRLTGGQAPAMSDDENSFAALKERCDKTIRYLESIERGSLDGAAERTVVMRFPQGGGYRWTGIEYLTGFALPNFLFHATTAYAILRGEGVPLGKPDFLRHLGMPLSEEQLAQAA